MHVKKNVFDNIFNTMIDIKGKMKDNVKAHMDLKEYYRRSELELQEQINGKVSTPKERFTLNINKKRAMCTKCPVFMEYLLLMAFCALLDDIQKPLTELSQFFKDICSIVL